MRGQTELTPVITPVNNVGTLPSVPAFYRSDPCARPLPKNGKERGTQVKTNPSE